MNRYHLPLNLYFHSLHFHQKQINFILHFIRYTTVFFVFCVSIVRLVCLLTGRLARTDIQFKNKYRRRFKLLLSVKIIQTKKKQCEKISFHAPEIQRKKEKLYNDEKSELNFIFIENWIFFIAVIVVMKADKRRKNFLPCTAYFLLYSIHLFSILFPSVFSLQTAFHIGSLT